MRSRYVLGLLLCSLLAGCDQSGSGGNHSGKAASTDSPTRLASDDAIQACVVANRPDECAQYTSIVKVQEVDERQVQGGVEVLANIRFQVKKPFFGDGPWSNVAGACTGTTWDMDPAKVRSTDVRYSGHQFISGQKLRVEATLTFERWSSGELRCTRQPFRASQSWYGN